MKKCKCGRKLERTIKTVCCVPDCYNWTHNAGIHIKPFYRAHPNITLHTDKSCGICSYHHIKKNDHFGNYTKYRGDECSNIDGRLGFKCNGIKHYPEDIRKCVLTVDHIDENHDHDPKMGNSHIWIKNLQDFCF